MHKLIASLGFLVAVLSLPAQNELWLESVNLPLNSGLQSYAHGEHQGKWYLFGGRLDGLHRRQPWASFDNAGHNEEIWVIAADTTAYKLSLSGISTTKFDQLRSTNINFYQLGDYLFLVGGYGISQASGNHISHPYLSIIDLSQLASLQAGDSIPDAAVQQIYDEDFAITGGSLKRLDSTFYLLGGHRFDGRYNPMNGPSFTQTYSNAVRRFQLSGNFPNLTVQWDSSFIDPNLLHRRDYNVSPEIREDGTMGLVAFSGVFQVQNDLPYLNAVRINQTGISEIPNFSQYYNHYHCANVAIYDPYNKAMHHLFFGGMAQYFDQNGVRTQDNNVPFVKTIARVSRDSLGQFQETKLQVEMPALLGSGSEFFIAPGIIEYEPGIIDYSRLNGDSILIGYIFGGIESSAPNIFFTNTGTQSNATAKLYKVWMIKSQLQIGAVEIEQKSPKLPWQLAPNPGGRPQIWYPAPEASGTFKVVFRDESGKLIWQEEWIHNNPDLSGHFDINPQELNTGIYLVSLYLNDELLSLQRWIRN